MNHYPHHVGDYLKDTAHLSLLEHGCYRRMLDVYYTREGPLPVELPAVCRLVGATAPAEKKAVQAVLGEFFRKDYDGWHQPRADAEIALYQSGAEEREQKAQHEVERMRRHRERRKQLFDALREVGIVPKWDTKLDELQRLLNANSNAPATRTVTELQREQAPDNNAPATAIQNQNQNQNQNHRERSASPTGSRLALESLPEDWAQFARQENPVADPERTFLKFRDHWQSAAGARGRKADWYATWRNWVRREKEFTPNGHGQPDYSSVIANLQD